MLVMKFVRQWDSASRGTLAPGRGAGAGREWINQCEEEGGILAGGADGHQHCPREGQQTPGDRGVWQLPAIAIMHLIPVILFAFCHPTLFLFFSTLIGRQTR